MRLIVVGLGSVGQGFVEVLRENAEYLRSDHHLQPRVVGLADSRGAAASELLLKEGWL